MPELPEVEIVSRLLNNVVSGRRISSARLLRPLLAPATTPRNFALRLRKKRINFVHRRGKHILFDLSGDTSLIVHLRMSGRFLLLTPEEEDPKFTHALFLFDDGARLAFADQRHFGMMNVVNTSGLIQAKELSRLAPEPFSSEFTPEYLHRVLSSSKRSIKEVLLDQTKVCGLGNIYAAEAMFMARVHPVTPSYRVSRRKVRALHSAIREVFRIAMEHADAIPAKTNDLEGTYFSSTGDLWMVYDREGDRCRVCSTAIERLRQGGRSTYFCRRCQRKVRLDTTR